MVAPARANFRICNSNRVPRPRHGETVTTDESGLNRLDWSQSRMTDQEVAENPAVLLQSRSRALAEIARTHHSALVRYLTLRTGSTEDAKDVVQEAYAKLLALDQPGTIGFLVRYLWRVATNLATDRGRQGAARSRIETALQPVNGSSPSTESIVDSLQRLAVVEKAISELPQRCRQALLFRVVEGQRFAQIGKEMGITERMAKIHVARAMEYLQHCLDSAEAPRSDK